MKEFEMRNYKIKELNSNTRESGGVVRVKLNIEMEYLVSYWYIGETMGDERKDFFFYNDDYCIYLEDASVEAITGGSKEDNGIKLSVYDEIAEGNDKGDISKEIV